MENKKKNSLRTFFVIIGAIVSIGAILVVLYTVLKKYFKITFTCDGECDCCDGDCTDYFDEENENYEPICCCDECTEEADDEAILADDEEEAL